LHTLRCNANIRKGRVLWACLGFYEAHGTKQDYQHKLRGPAEPKQVAHFSQVFYVVVSPIYAEFYN